MTRKNFTKGIIALLFPFAAQAAKKNDIWSTPQGKLVLAMRDRLEILGVWDDLPEDWDNVKDHLTAGHLFYVPQVSRQVQEGGKIRLLYNIRPVEWVMEVHANGFRTLSATTTTHLPGR